MRYSEIVASIKTLEAEKDTLAEKIYADMTEQAIDQVKSDYGTFYFTVRKTWVYPDYIKEQEALLKNHKKEAEIKGDAAFEEKKSLAYKQSQSNF